MVGLGTSRLLNLLQKPLSLNTRRNFEHHDDVDKLGKEREQQEDRCRLLKSITLVNGLFAH